MNSRPPRMSRAPDELGGDEAAGLKRNRREVDVLATMMGADSQRIDSLVDDVGTIKGAVTNLHSGQPMLVLHGALHEWFEARSLTAHLTVTDETDYAASFCVVEQAVR